jgi:hypothetical protein
MTHNALLSARDEQDYKGPDSNLPDDRASAFGGQAEPSTPATQRRWKTSRFERSVLLGHSSPDRVLLLPRDVEVLTGDSPAQLGRLRRRGEGPTCSAFGRYYLYRLSDVLIWLGTRAASEIGARHDG